MATARPPKVRSRPARGARAPRRRTPELRTQQRRLSLDAERPGPQATGAVHRRGIAQLGRACGCQAAASARDDLNAQRLLDEGEAISSVGGGAMTSGTLIAPPERSLDAERLERTVYRRGCGHALRVFGDSHHRVYFEVGVIRFDDPVMNRVCPGCGRALAGKNGP